MFQLKPDTRVVRVENGVPGAVLGTVKEIAITHCVVEWDDGGWSFTHMDRLIPHQKLKSWFKYGPKLHKSKLPATG